jgi:membrane associated rhomboid family serine protease
MNALLDAYSSVNWRLMVNADVYIQSSLLRGEEGNFVLWMSYILTGAGADLISWLVLPTSSVSLGASGAVFGLFTIMSL